MSGNEIGTLLMLCCVLAPIAFILINFKIFLMILGVATIILVIVVVLDLRKKYKK